MAGNRWPGVYKRGNSWSYRAQFGDGDARWGVSGSGFPTAKAAHDAKVEDVRRSRPMNGIVQRPDATLTLSGYLEIWYEEHTRLQKPSTRSAHRTRINMIQRSPVADKRLRGLTESDYRTLVEDLRQQSPSHTNLTLKLGTLKAALNAAVRAGLIPNHPLAQIKPSRTSAKFEPGYWNVPTVHKFLAHRRSVGDPLYLTYHLALVTGLRRGELHGLRREDFDLERGLLRVRRQRIEVRGVVHELIPKTEGSEAPVYLDPETVELLRAHVWTSDYMTNDPRTGQPYSLIRTFSYDFARACRDAGVPSIRFHDLRHTSASLLAAAGVPLVLAQARLRHWSPSMTERYTHALDGMGSQVAETIGALVAGA